jgi:hypothetical protein
MGNADRIYLLKETNMESEEVIKKELNHPYTAISLVNNASKGRYQAVCNPIKCGWHGTVTNDLSLAEAERDAHIQSVEKLNDQ